MTGRSSQNAHEYELLIRNQHSKRKDTSQPQRPIKPASSSSSKWDTFASGFWIGLVITAIVFLLALWLTSFTNKSHETPGKLAILNTPGLIARNFSPNESFRLGISGSDEAWRSILPEGLGFVQHPDLGPEILGLAFVHQIHCLDILRNAFDTTHKRDSTANHVSHCIEYLRNSIMCHADANLEYRKVNNKTGSLATPGNDIHYCKDFHELFDFAEKWRVYDGKSVSEKRRIEEDPMRSSRTIHYDYVSSRGDPVPHDE